MADNNSLVAMFKNHTDAEDAVKELQKAGFDMKKLSIIGKDYHTEDNVVGYYNTGDRMKVWGKFGAFWGAIWGLLMGSAFLIIPGVGPVMVAGPLVAAIIGAVESAIVIGGLSAIGAALFSIGIPKDSVVRYETAIKADQFLLLVHGTPDEVQKAKTIIDTTKATESTIHKELVAQKA